MSRRRTEGSKIWSKDLRTKCFKTRREKYDLEESCVENGRKVGVFTVETTKNQGNI